MAYVFLFVILMYIVSCSESIPEYRLEDFIQEDSPSELSENKLQPCGENLCRCNKTFARCTDHYDNLTYIPKLTDRIEKLNFISNNLANITSSTFQNISTFQILYLCLRNNTITHIAANAFVDFTVIGHLDLRSNPISAKDLAPALYGLRYSRLAYLAIANTDLTCIGKNAFEGVTFVQKLLLNNINITQVDFKVMFKLRFLSNLDLSYNKISYIRGPLLPSLKQLRIFSNNLKRFPGFCKKTNDSSLQILDLSHNQLSSVVPSDLKCLRSLTSLMLVGNKLKVIESNAFFYLSNLKYLYLNSGFVKRSVTGQRIEGYAFNNSALTTLFANDIDFVFSKNVDKYAFRGCNNLMHLYLKYDNLFTADDGYLMDLLGELTTLKGLNMTHCQLRFFPAVISERLTNIETLGMFGNQISVINKGSFDRMLQLKFISLGGNSIVHIPGEIFSSQIRKQLSLIDLSRNPYTCTCDNLWFIQWLKADHKKFIGYPLLYNCKGPSDPKSTLMVNASLSEEICSLSSVVVPLILSITGFVVVSLVLTSIIYRWRWHIRYYIHMLRYKRGNQLRDKEQNLFMFDAFVLFCDDDFCWVSDHLMPKLEDEGGMKLCVHQRDFTPGKYIVNNILECLENSRRVVLLLSNTFNESSWCEFELTLVQKRALENQEGYLVVILLEDLEARNMTSSLCALLQTTTYIKWPREEENRALFWERVKTSLG